MSALITVCISLSLCLSHISLISAHPALFISACTAALSPLSFSSFFHVFHLFAASLSLMERRRGEGQTQELLLNVSLLSVVIHLMPRPRDISALINWHCSA